MSAPIEVRFILSRREALSSIRWLTWKRSRISLALVGILAILMAACVAVSHHRSGRPGGIGWAIFFVALFGAVILYSIIIAPDRAYRRFPQTFREGEQAWRFAEDGVDARGPTLESKCLWTTWIEFAETRDCFLLFPQKNMAHMIPKRAFASPEEIDRFRDLARHRILPT